MFIKLGDKIIYDEFQMMLNIITPCTLKLIENQYL